MSLLAMPFVGTTADTALHVVSLIVTLSVIAGLGYGFWRIHELPTHHAHAKKRTQMALVTVLAAIGFFVHELWYIAVLLAYFDGDAAIKSIRNSWEDKSC